MNKELQLEKMEHHLQQNNIHIRRQFETVKEELNSLNKVLDKIDSIDEKIKTNNGFTASDIQSLKSVLQDDIARMIILTDSLQSTCATILEDAKQGLGYVFGKASSWPKSILKNDVPVALIIQGGRNQAAHWREFVYDDAEVRGKIQEAFKAMFDKVDSANKHFYDLSKDDAAQDNPTNRNRANHVLKFLEWNTYEEYQDTMLSFVQ